MSKKKETLEEKFEKVLPTGHYLNPNWEKDVAKELAKIAKKEALQAFEEAIDGKKLFVLGRVDAFNNEPVIRQQRFKELVREIRRRIKEKFLK